MSLLITVQAADGATTTVTLPPPVVLQPSTSAVYSNVGTIFDSGFPVAAGTRVGYVVMQPQNWVGTITFDDSRFVASHFSGGTYAVTTTAALPTGTLVVTPYKTFP